MVAFKTLTHVQQDIDQSQYMVLWPTQRVLRVEYAELEGPEQVEKAMLLYGANRNTVCQACTCPNLNVPPQGSKLSAFTNSSVEERQAEQHLLEHARTQTGVEPIALDVVKGPQQVRPHALWGIGERNIGWFSSHLGLVQRQTRSITLRWQQHAVSQATITLGGSLVIFTPF